MKNTKYTLFLFFFIVFFSTSCSVSKNKISGEKGWAIVTTEKSKYTPLEYLTMRLHCVDYPNDTITFSIFIVNGVDLTTEGVQKRVRVANGVYKIEATSLPFYPVEVTIRKKANYDLFIDFYLKSVTSYMKVKR